MPARVHDAKLAQIKPQWQRLEPLDVLRALRAGDLIEKILVLATVLGVVGSQKATAADRILGVVRDCVELVVAHHDLGGADVNHGLDEFEDTQLLRTAVDQVADENRLAFRMPVGPGVVEFVAKILQQRL